MAIYISTKIAECIGNIVATPTVATGSPYGETLPFVAVNIDQLSTSINIHPIAPV